MSLVLAPHMSRPGRKTSRAMRTSIPHSVVRHNSVEPRRWVDGPSLHGSIDIDTSAEFSDNEGGDERHLVRQRTQESQDKEDDGARKKAMKELVQSWMDRLQLISVLTTFFSAMEAQLLGSAIPDSSSPDSVISQVSVVCMICALIVHSFAAIISFLAAFALIRYKLKEAKKEELKVEGFTYASPISAEAQAIPQEETDDKPSPSDPQSSKHPSTVDLADPSNPTFPPILSHHYTPINIPIFTTDPHLEQVGPFRTRQPPTGLLERAHTLCISMATVGFVLIMVGIVFWAWAQLPRSVSVAATAAVVMCTGPAVGILFFGA